MYDVGFASALLGAQPFKGSLLENMVVVELIKPHINKGKPNHLNFWRNSKGNEINIPVNDFEALVPTEIKSGTTINQHYFKGLKLWNNTTVFKGGARWFTLGADYRKRSPGFEVIPLNLLTEKIDN